MLKIHKINKSFAKKVILKDISLSFPTGRLITLLGENGAGKSTLLKVIAGRTFPDSGEITYKDQSIENLNFKYVHDIRFIHEDIVLNVPMTFKAYVHELKNSIPDWDQAFFDEMVIDRNIDIDTHYKNFSRGQKMQVNLMLALASRVKLLLIDEITSVIDVYSRKYFLDLLGNYVKTGNTVIITTNIISELELYTDHLIILKDAEIVLNKGINSITLDFVKIRKTSHQDHEIFNDKNCAWAGVNSDHSTSYIIPTKTYEDYGSPKMLIDKRKSTLEDIFIFFFSQKLKEGDSLENVA